MKLQLFFILLLSNIYILSAQVNHKVRFNDTYSQLRSLKDCIKAEKDYFWLYEGDYVFKKNYKNIILDSFYFDNSFSKPKLKIISKKNIPYIISISGGMVWSIVNDSFVRTDNSYNHKLTNHSSVFVHKDTIFKFGGYGYWSNRNFFTYYCENSNQWEFYPIDSKSKMPPALTAMQFSYDQNLFFVCGGSKVDPRNGITRKANNNIWHFNFDSKKWKDLGTSKFLDHDSHQWVEIGQNLHFVSNTIPNKSFQNNFIVDFNKNQSFPLKGLPDFPVDKTFFSNDTLFYLQNDVLKKYSLSSFKFLDKNTKPLYIDSTSLFKTLKIVAFIALMVMITALFFLYSKNRKRPKLTHSGLRFKSIHYPLSVKELKILNLIVHNKAVNSKALMKSIYDPELSPPQNNRIKLEIINSLNEKLSKIFLIDEFISFRKSRKDQRMIIYYTKHRKDFVL